MFLGLLAIALAAFVTSVLSVTCPTNCSCQTGTFSCQVCLEYYYQVYSLETKGCQCLPGFTLTDEVIDYCHPSNCKQANDWGCATCYPHATIQYVDTYQYYNCSCNQNYYLNLSTSLCSCLSTQTPTKYYEDTVLDLCLACPSGCTCNPSGCVSCDASTLRQIVPNQYFSTCYCKKPHLEANGTCQCAKNCTCNPDGTTSCDPSSNRQLVLGQWVCKHPYTEVNGQCKCQQPYMIVTTLGYQECVCMSKVNYTQYYQADGVCYQCGINCTCDYTGCLGCFDGSVYIQYQACMCSVNYVYRSPDCVCLDPYEVVVDNTTDETTCKCLSYRLPGYYSKGGFCAKCPAGCSCNSSGCFSCSDPLRAYQVDADGFSICSCKANSEQLEGSCRCTSLYQYNSTSRSCVCKNIPNLIFFDKDTASCNLCPDGCKCDPSGCFSCIGPAYRTIRTNSAGKKTCYCSAGFVEVDSECACPDGKTLSQGGTCDCLDPYYVNGSGMCSCKSDLDNTRYYYDDFEGQCKYCPRGCVCNVSGCIDCGSDFLRTIKYSLETLRYRCPCLQNAFLVGDYCTVCPNNSYAQYLGNVKNISCVKCVECLTCNRYGCTSCPPNTSLVDNSCLCDNATLVNKDGVCTCPDFQYLTNGDCQPCPSQCNSCIEKDSKVICTSCSSNSNRQNLPAEECPCKSGFKQSSNPSTFCCNQECEDCDATGCLSCPLSTYRTLVNNACICTNGFVEQYSLVCLCPAGYYLLNNECFRCPVQCLTCAFNSSLQTIVCSSCRENVNRKTSDPNCACLTQFSQTSNFPSQYCYANNCVDQVLNCTRCQDPWEIDTTEGQCICKKGYWVNAYSGYSDCTACTIQGCLNCISQLTCVECNESNSFYLIQTFCTQVNQFQYLAVQTTEQNIIIQFQLTNEYSAIDQISVSLNPIVQPNSGATLHAEVQFNVLEKKLLNNGSLLSVTLENINETYTNIIISYNLAVSNSLTSANNLGDSSSSQNTLKLNLKMDTIYSQQSFDPLYRVERVGLYTFVVITMIVAFGFYIFGFKHNQACYFMQTMSFLSFTISDPGLDTAMFLYNLRYSYYNFSPYNALSQLVPSDYIELSPGNYKYLTVDANIVRNIGIPLILALTVGVLAVIFRVFHEFTQNKPLLKPAGLAVFWKKIIYRTIEFFYKTLMYPLIFFSIQNLFNWNTTVYLHEQFRRKCSILSIIIICIYLLVTLFQYFLELISTFNKRQNVKQFLNCICGSLIIIGAQTHPKLVLLLIVVFIVSQLPYIRWRLHDLLVYQIANLCRLIIVIFEIICVILVCVVTRRPLIGMVCITILLQMSFLVYKALIDKHVNMISKLTSYALNEEQDEGTEAGGRDLSLKSEI